MALTEKTLDRDKSKQSKKQKIRKPTGIYSKKSPAFLKGSADPLPHRKTYANYRVPTDTEVNLLPARNVVNFIYENNIRSRNVFSIPDEVRRGISESSVAALLWRFGRKNRWKKQPEPHMVIYGRYCIPDFDTRKIEMSREGITIPMPIELKEGDKISWVQIWEKESVVTVRLIPKNEPFNISQIPNVAWQPDDGTD